MMNFLFKDSMRNVITRLGSGVDKGAANRHYYNELSNDELRTVYASSWTAKQIVDIPVEDATKKWRSWGGDEAEAAKIATLERTMGVQSKVVQGFTRARLYGGSALFIGAGSDVFEDPLLIEDVDKLHFLTPLTRLDLTAEKIETDLTSEFFGQPSMYSVQTGLGQKVRIHPSRLVIFRGFDVLDQSRFSLSGRDINWGMSVLHPAIEPIRQYDACMASVNSLVSEAKTDVIKIKDLTKNLKNKGYEDNLTKRMQVARDLKGIHGILALDGEEEYESSTYSFSGFGDVIDRMMVATAGASDIPVTRLFGMSPGGLNATGEGDLTNYYDGVSSLQSNYLSPALWVLDQVLAKAATASEDISKFQPEWRPIKKMTEKEISENNERNAKTVKTLTETRLFDEQALAEASTSIMTEGGFKGLEFSEARDDDL